MIVGTAGHIDHGKTALVRALTGVDADRLPEEKARGITLDLGFAYWPRPDGRIIGYILAGSDQFGQLYDMRPTDLTVEDLRVI